MPTRDNFSNQVVVEALAPTVINTDTVTNGNIIDTVDYDDGIRFALKALPFDDGVFSLSFEEGDDPALSDAVAVDSEKIIGDTVSVNAATVVTDPWPGNGLFSVKRYVRAVVTSTGGTFGDTTVEVVALLSGEYNPQDQ